MKPDPEYQGMGGLSQVGASTYYNGGSNPNGYTGSGVTVAVIDTGIDIDHPEFAGALHPGSRSLVGGSVDDIGAHGTAVAGIVGAARDGSVMHGIAFNSTILALRTDIPGTCPASCLYSQAALQAATDVAVTEGADVVNYSLGSFGATSNGWRNSMINAANNGAVIVAAAGNEFNNPDPIIAALAVNPINPAALVATEPGLQGPMIAAGAYDTALGDIANFSKPGRYRAGLLSDGARGEPGLHQYRRRLYHCQRHLLRGADDRRRGGTAEGAVPGSDGRPRSSISCLSARPISASPAPMRYTAAG